MLLGAIVGATASGKTALSVCVARALGAEIICADSRQVYHGFRIGTSQPTQAERNAVTHHLVDFLDPGESYSAGRFLRDVTELLARNPSVPYLIVGGTGLYLQVLRDGIAELPDTDPMLRSRLQRIQQRRGTGFLRSWYAARDPEGAQHLKHGDTQRVLRFLEISLQTGRTRKDWASARKGGIGSFPVVWLDPPREEIRARIDQRLDAMVRNGWMEEALTLARQYPLSAPAFGSIGYKEMLLVAQGHLPVAEALGIVRKATHQYAKRQVTWFRHQLSECCRISRLEDETGKIFEYFKKKP